MAKETRTIAFEDRPCDVCGQVTHQQVHQVRAGGRVIADHGRCLEHETFTSGRVDRLINGEWVTVKPAPS